MVQDTTGWSRMVPKCSPDGIFLKRSQEPAKSPFFKIHCQRFSSRAHDLPVVLVTIFQITQISCKLWNMGKLTLPLPQSPSSISYFTAPQFRQYFTIFWTPAYIINVNSYCIFGFRVDWLSYSYLRRTYRMKPLQKVSEFSISPKYLPDQLISILGNDSYLKMECLGIIFFPINTLMPSDQSLLLNNFSEANGQPTTIP